MVSGNYEVKERFYPENKLEGVQMKAVAWHGKRDVRVDDVPDPTIQEPTDAIVRITTTAICGSDLHLYEVLGMFIEEGDILGHETMGIVEEVGPEVTNLSPSDRVVMPFQISCGHCFMCDRGLQTQCETTQVREQNMGAALFGYTKLYGKVDGGQAEFLRVPQAQYTHIKVPDGPPDERFVYLSDVLPTAWQAVEYAGIPEGGSVTVLGLGPIGDMATRIALHRGHRVIAVDLVPERLERARRWGAEVLDLNEYDDVAGEIREMTDGRGTDSVIDAVGMEAHGSPGAGVAQQLTGLLPDSLAQGAMQEAGVDRLNAFLLAIDAVRRGGTISLSGVYGGQADPLPMLTLFDKQIQLRMGQANVKHWVDDIMPLLAGDGDPLGVEGFHTHQLPLEQAPHGYEIIQKKQDGAVKAAQAVVGQRRHPESSGEHRLPICRRAVLMRCFIFSSEGVSCAVMRGRSRLPFWVTSSRSEGRSGWRRARTPSSRHVSFEPDSWRRQELYVGFTLGGFRI